MLPAARLFRQTTNRHHDGERPRPLLFCTSAPTRHAHRRARTPSQAALTKKDIAGAYVGNGCCCSPSCCKVWIEEEGNPCCAEGACIYQAICGCGPKCPCGCFYFPCGMCGTDVWAMYVPPQSLALFKHTSATEAKPCCCGCGAGYVKANTQGGGPPPAMEEMAR